MADPNLRGDDGIDSAAYARHETAIAVIMNLFFVRHLIQTYEAFDGDLLEAIVLGEIAHHNIAALRASASSPHELSEVLAGTRPPAATMLPTNAFSIAQASGIPRETVRRKVASLERRGWITRDGEGNLHVTDRPMLRFGAFNRERCSELLQAARDIEQLLGAPPGAASRSRPTARRAQTARTGARRHRPTK